MSNKVVCAIFISFILLLNGCGYHSVNQIEQITFDENSYGSLAWSSNGRYLIMSSYQADENIAQLYLHDLDTATHTNVFSNPNNNLIFALSWSPDDQYVLLHEGTYPYYLYKISLEDLQSRYLDRNTLSPLVNDSDVIAADWSPDGKWIFCLSGYGEAYRGYLYNVEAGTVINLTLEEGLYLDVAWHPSEPKVAVIYLENITALDSILEISFSGDMNNPQITVTPIVMEIEFPIDDLDWHPNGQYLLFSTLDNEEVLTYIYSLEDNNMVQITTNGLEGFSLKWSSDGNQIVFVSDVDGFDNIYIMDFDIDSIQQR